MKTTLLLLLLIFLTLPTVGQNVEFKLYQITNNQVFQKVRNHGSISDLSDDEMKKVRLVKEIYDLNEDIKEDVKSNSAEVDSRFYLEAWRNGSRITLAEAGFTGIKISNHDFFKGDFNGSKTYYVFTFKDLGDKPGKNELLKIEVLREGNAFKTFGVFYNNGFELYGWGGFWLPTNMYSFNGKSSTEGIQVGIYPIAGAWGFKSRWGAGMRYIGTSITLNPGYSTSAEDNSVFINSLSIGPVMDFGGLVYIGYHKGFDLTSNQNQQLEDQIIVGFSLKLVSLFTNGE